MITECTRESVVLIDGYNLYHSLLAIEEHAGHKVRWLDVRKLSELLLNRLFPPKCPYPNILFFTAYSSHKGADHVDRQKSYHQCLKRMGVKVVTDGNWAKKDVPIGMHLGPKAKWVCIISGDADLMPAINLFSEAYPHVDLGIARPFKRETRKMHMKNCTNISPEDCLACLLPNPAPTKKRDVHKPAHW